MPRKNKTPYKTFNSNSSVRSPRLSADGEVFRNFFAVNDDVDPLVSLRSLKEMFSGKVEEDVIQMIFSECAYDVDQTVETLFTLSNDKQSVPSEPSDSLSPKSSCKKISYKASHLGCVQDTATGEFVSSLSPSAPPFVPSFLESNNNDLIIKETINNGSNHLYSDIKIPPEAPCVLEQYNFINSEHNRSFEGSKKDFLETEFPQSELRSSSADSHVFKTYSESVAEVAQENSERKESPFYASPKVANKSWQSSSSSIRTPMYNAQASPHFITPFIPLRGKFNTPTQESFGGNNFSPSGQKNWFTVSSRKKPTSIPTNVNDISSRIIDGHNVLVLLRGLPGSGKSTLAKELRFSGVSYSTDDFFVKKGNYKFDWKKLSEAHEWNKRRTLEALQRGITPVIIDNTNTEAWEMLPYVKLAMQFNYEVYILEPNTPWKFKPSKLFKRNIHHVSREKIEKMLERYDHNITVESLKRMLRNSSGIEYRSSSSSERDSVETEKPGSNSREGTPNDPNDVDKLHSSSSDSLVEDCGSHDSQFVSSEVEVHKEQDSDDVNSDQSNESVYPIEGSDLKNSGSDQDNISKLTDQKPCVQEWSEISDIDKLKLLMREGSEESQSCGLTQQSSDSNQEVSGWESITEHDEDFLWSGGSFGFLIAAHAARTNLSGRSNYSNHCLRDCEESKKDNEYMRLPSPPDFNNVHASSQCKNFDDLVAVNIKDTVEDDAHAAYSQNPISALKDNEWSDVKPDDVLQSWNMAASIEKSSILDNFHSEPKPQREELRSLSSSKVNPKQQDILSSVLNTTEIQNKKNSKLFSSIDLSADWVMPNFESHDIDNLHEDCRIDNNAVLKTNFGTQTDPNDFVLCHKLDTNELFVTTMKTLKPSLILENISNAALDENEGIPFTLRLDKSTSTVDIPQDIEGSEKIEILKSCFPEISEDDLVHLLNICHGDNTWLSSILLEWGYKYNVPKLKSESILGCHDKPAAEGSEQVEISYSHEPASNMLFDNSITFEEVCALSDISDQQYQASRCSVPEIKEDSCKISSTPLTLVLSQDLALDLQQLFGPVTDSFKDDVPDHLRTITLDYNLAQSLFNKWRECIALLNPSEEVRQKQAKKPVDSAGCVAPAKNDKIYYRELSNKKICLDTDGSNSLSEIMDMEYAIQLSRNEKLKKEKQKGNALAIKLNRIELHRMFPGVDTMALDDVFDSNNCNLEKTLLALEADIGKPAKLTPENPPVFIHKSDIAEEFSSGNWTDWVHEDGFLNQEEVTSVDSTPEAEQWRAEAAMHYQIHQECVNKSRSAYYSGMRDVASFYSQKGHFHKMKFRAANKKASELILQNRNACLDSQVLDLHGLYVQEAIPQLKKFLKANLDKIILRTPSEHPQQLAITVITGRGAHSIRGAKLRPSVINFLNSSGYRFDEINLGVFNICLLPPTP